MSDTIVIGGGVMGLGAALALRRTGRPVRLLERAQPGRAASWASAGIIGATLRDESDPRFALRQLSSGLWPAFAADVQAASGIDPEFSLSGCIQLAETPRDLEQLAAAAAREPGARVLDRAALHELEPALAPDLPGGLLVTGGSVDPRRLCRALELAARRAGVTIESGVEVMELSTAEGRVSGVDTSRGRRAAELVVLAAGAWAALVGGVLPEAPVRPQKGQILAIDQAAVGIRHVLLTAADPYFVPRVDGRLVVGATREEAGWDPTLTVDGVGWLLARAGAVVPALRQCAIVELWTGFRPLAVDGLPLIGPGSVAGLYFLTGHGPSGIAPLPGSLALLMAAIDGTPPAVDPAPFAPLRVS